MFTPHYPRIDALATISKRYADDAALPPSSRERFLRSYYLASVLKHFSALPGSDNLAHAFQTMCCACKEARLHSCDPSRASMHCCRLIGDDAA